MYFRTVPPPELLQASALKPQSPLPYPCPSLQDTFFLIMTPLLPISSHLGCLHLPLALPHSQTCNITLSGTQRFLVVFWLLHLCPLPHSCTGPHPEFSSQCVSASWLSSSLLILGVILPLLIFPATFQFLLVHNSIAKNPKI